ncbi:MAG TPA: hypothetical protein PK537_12275 [Candidatus Limiplasma sp.]|nr:hypothetical protein [Candidatus Limiplasma sp.]
MSNELKLQKTEKAAVNIGVVEMAQIDVLVENMLYTNRSDFIRTAIRKALEYHQDYIHDLLRRDRETRNEERVETIGGIGVIRLSVNDLLRLRSQGKKASIMVVGVLVVERAMDADLFTSQIVSIKVYGKIHAPKQLGRIFAEKAVNYDA